MPPISESIFKTVWFLVIAIAGYGIIITLPHLTIMAGIYPLELPPEEYQRFQYWFFGGGTWIWLMAVLVSIGYFFAAGPVRRILLWAPVYMTALYCTGVLAYFSTAQ